MFFMICTKILIMKKKEKQTPVLVPWVWYLGSGAQWYEQLDHSARYWGPVDYPSLGKTYSEVLLVMISCTAAGRSACDGVQQLSGTRVLYVGILPSPIFFHIQQRQQAQ